MSARVLITGAAGMLGRELLARAAPRFQAVGSVHETPLADAERCDLADGLAVRRLVARIAPAWVVHTVALTNVDACERDPELAHRTNVVTTRHVCDAARDAGARVVYISTDQVFDGRRGGYRPDERISPINVYGRTKAEGEAAALESGGLVVRTNFFGWSRSAKASFSDWVLTSLRSQTVIPVWTDCWFTPLSMAALAEVLFDAMERGLSGVRHIVGLDRVSKAEMAGRLASVFGLPADRLKPSSMRDAPLAAPRPADMSLDPGPDRTLVASRVGSLQADLERLKREEPARRNG